MRNAWIICRKELGSYFVSPVAYLLLTMFGLIFGFFFWNALGYFVIEGMQMQMRGQSFPMNLNEQIIRPLLSNVSVVGLFFIPMITMRLFAEEKRTGTIELLATSPVRDLEIIVGKWLAAMMLYACMLLFTALNFALSLSATAIRIGSLWQSVIWACCCRQVRCWPSGHLFPRSPRIRSSPAPRRLAFACCCGCWSGRADTKRQPGRACLPTCRSSRTSNPLAGACSIPKTQSFISP